MKCFQIIILAILLTFTNSYRILRRLSTLTTDRQRESESETKDERLHQVLKKFEEKKFDGFEMGPNPEKHPKAYQEYEKDHNLGTILVNKVEEAAHDVANKLFHQDQESPHHDQEASPHPDQEEPSYDQGDSPHDDQEPPPHDDPYAD